MPIDFTLVPNAYESCRIIFDGSVLEIFDTLTPGKTRRYHAALLAGIGIATDQKGKHTLTVQAVGGFKDNLTVPDGTLPAAQALVAEVQGAIGVPVAASPPTLLS